MKAKNMIKKVLSVFIFGWFLTSSISLLAQCPTDVNYGQNIVVNGDFSNGYTGWAFTPQTVPWNPAVVGAADGYRVHGSPSLPGDIFVGTNPNAQFNGGFQTFGDHTSGSGNFLMVDGVCKLGVKLFTQTVTVAPMTNYYFSVWINSLKDNPTNPGVLNFDVGGSNIGANITAPSLGGASVGGGWIKHEVVWNSGATSGSVVISIENQNTLDCGNQVDFAIDDIAFIPGCSYGAPGPQPDLGPDQTLCGKGGSITLNANVPMLPTTTVSWSDGTTNTGANPAFYSKVITAPGTYSVCVSDNGSCVKSDVIVITNTFSINIGGPYNFCSSTSQVLDAGFTGIGVTYKWYRNNVLVPFPNDTKTYTATSAGTYRVDVTVPGCGTQSASATITSSAPVAPVDAYYCATSGPASVTLGATGANSANLSWYSVATGGTPIASGVSAPNATTTQYALPTIPMGTTATQLYYVQDETVSTGTVGATTFSNGNNADGSSSWNQNYLTITPGGDFTINSLQIPFIFYSGTPPAFNVTIEVGDASGNSLSPVRRFTSSNTATPITIGSSKLYTFNFTGFTVLKSWGSTLTLKIYSNTSSGGQTMVSTSGYSGYPYASSIPSVVSIINSKINGNATTNGGYAYLFNMNISAKTICSRTLVRAISNCPTPVTWTSFYLVPQNNSCKLVWSTADETNNSYFAIERSVDGVHFETIGTASGAGNRDLATNYFYIDNAPLPGTSYYRITQHDYDGTFSSTAIRPYSSEGLVEVTTYPNPFQNSTTLLVSGADAESYTYTLYSVSGQLVEQGSGTMNQSAIIAETPSKGMYVLTVLSSTGIVTTKIVKQ